MPPLFRGEFWGGFGGKGDVGEAGGSLFDSFEVAVFGHYLVVFHGDGVGMVGDGFIGGDVADNGEEVAAEGFSQVVPRV